jgi:hypothetical protein
MPKKTKKKPEKKTDAQYEAYRAEWERRRKTPDRAGGEWLVEKPVLPVDPLPLLQTLRRLGYLTQDSRYVELHRHVMGLIDPATEKWSLLDTKITRQLPELIEGAIAEGVTKRQAIAEAVAVLVLHPDANSFKAACKRLERQLDERREALDKNRPKNV